MKNLAILLPIFLFPTLAFASCGDVSNAQISTSTVFYSTNIDRCQVGDKPLQYNAQLATAAQEKADQMASESYFGHISPQGQGVWGTIRQSGYDYFYAGENLAYSFTNNLDLNQAWLNSPSHKENILATRYMDVGIGMHGPFVVVVFGTRKFAQDL